MTLAPVSKLRLDPGKRLVFALIFVVTCSLGINAQDQKTKSKNKTTPLVSPQKKLSKKQFIKDSVEIMRVRMVRPQVRLDNRITFNNGQTLNINGLDAGVLLKEKLRIAIGYYALSSDLNEFKTVVDGAIIQRFIKLNYASINTEYIYLNTRFISLGMPLDFGFGSTHINYWNITTNQTYGKQGGFVMLTDFGLSTIFKPTRWVGIRGVIGYRKYLVNPISDFNFGSFFVSIGVHVDLREISKDYMMFKLKKKYKRGNSLENAVDLITD